MTLFIMVIEGLLINICESGMLCDLIFLKCFYLTSIFNA